MYHVPIRTVIFLYWTINSLGTNCKSSAFLLTKERLDTHAMYPNEYSGAFCAADSHQSSSFYVTIIRQCGRELVQLLQAQFPWRPSDGDTGTVMDPKDSLDNLCKVYDRTTKCIDMRLGYLEDGCKIYAFSGNYFEVRITLSLLCSQTDRAQLVRSLECLSVKGVLNSLGLRAWKKCGLEILTNQTDAMKNALFIISNFTYVTQISELLQKVQKSLYCVPDDHLHCFLSDVLELCGNDAMSLVQDYFAHLQDFITNVWFPSNIDKGNICRHQQWITSNSTNSGKQKHNRKYYNDTALQTHHGRQLLIGFKKSWMSKGVCYNRTADMGYRITVHALFVKDEPVRFNLFHFAHGLTIFRPYSVSCHTGDFTQIKKQWGLWRNVCPTVRSYLYPLTVLIEGCRLYDLFDSQFAHCQWEDMLIGIYARAAAITKSPNTGHWVPGGSNYLLLDGMYEYYGVKQWADYTRRPLDLIRQSLDEITFKCGQGMTSALKEFYDKLEYYMFDSILQRKSLNS